MTDPAVGPAPPARAVGGGLPQLPAMTASPPRRLPPGGARRHWQTARVVEVRPEAARVRTYRLTLPDWQRHVAGQHYVVRLVAADGYRAERSYSVASPPDDEGHIELTVERLLDGEVSAYLFDAVEPGDELTVRGPFGGWFVWRGDVPAVLVGGGSGVVPLMAMLRHRRRRAAEVPVRLVVSVRSPADLIYAGEYGDESTVVYTRSAPPECPRPPGRLRAEDLAPALLPGATVYVCGSAAFAGHAEALVLGLGVPPGDIRVERFGPG